MGNKYILIIIQFFLFPIFVIYNSVLNWFNLIIDLFKNIRIVHKFKVLGL